MASWDDVYARMGNQGQPKSNFQQDALDASAAMGHVPGQGHRSQPGGVGGQGRWSQTGFIPPDQRGAPMSPAGMGQVGTKPMGAGGANPAALAMALRGAGSQLSGGMMGGSGMAMGGAGGMGSSMGGDAYGQGFKPGAMEDAYGSGMAMPTMPTRPGMGAPVNEFGGGMMGWEMGMPRQPAQSPATPWGGMNTQMYPPVTAPQQPQQQQQPWSGFGGYSQQ